ncbi:sigma-B regulation protein RsbU (phosphoserine phosphatase) [Aneurinibacillus soli]|uniref:Phosphoserine phosphatase RsbP n=1 Tax=Aneurinibacillus soli TaxID=1500254 RepID=A0A0U4NB01_9BACL|nr:PP2C family protein-serine/threonine phosphatase [Aneurinibacillus soli]PYE57817.1 sigma-B regulation protein RsbU (phosphoserine phosphatase) [Aneurinibacillus soli]BAU26228.1 Phosphoserine phosphatase RsbP [Aneurinibacillus soli]
MSESAGTILLLGTPQPLMRSLLSMQYRLLEVKDVSHLRRVMERVTTVELVLVSAASAEKAEKLKEAIHELRNVEPLLPILLDCPGLYFEDRLLYFDRGVAYIFSYPLDVREVRLMVQKYIAHARSLNERMSRFHAVQKELNIATLVQKSLHPQKVKKGAIRFTYIHQPYYLLGGDLFEFIPLDDGKAALFLLDVSGHGFSACLITMAIRTLLGGLATKVTDPATVMKELDAHLCRLFFRLPETMFVSCIYVVIDVSTGTVEYANAGHPNGYVLDMEANTLHCLGSTSLPLGIIETNRHETKRLEVEKMGRLMLMTDGVYEKGHDPEGNAKRIEQLTTIFRSSDYHELDPLQMRLKQEIQKEHPTREDDYTMLLIEWGEGNEHR